MASCARPVVEVEGPRPVRRRRCTSTPGTKRVAAARTCCSGGLDELMYRVYFHVAMQLDFETLLRFDATCRYAREANRSSGGRWLSLGRDTFYGVELAGAGPFERPSGTGPEGELLGLAAPNWKQRYARFASGLKAFAAPFLNPEIRSITNDDEVAYFQCLLRTDILASESARGVYLEVEVIANPDNFSLSMVDFDDGGSSSLSFSPDTGAVINERKVCESPRKVRGMFVQALEGIPAEQKFHGRVGLFVHRGRVAFYRMSCGERGSSEPVAWETTGFVAELAWAEGRRLTPCIAFRSAGHYEVRTTCVGTLPPFVPSVMGKDQSLEWCCLDWEDVS